MSREPWTRRRVAVAACLAAVAAAAGCVERRYTIRTDPPGANVIVNGEEIGPSPVSRSFVYYGDREVIVTADGFQTQRFTQRCRAPWWNTGLTDWFTENILPVTVRDDREWTFKLQPATVPDREGLVARAGALRQQGKALPPQRRKGILGFLGF